MQAELHVYKNHINCYVLVLFLLSLSSAFIKHVCRGVEEYGNGKSGDDLCPLP